MPIICRRQQWDLVRIGNARPRLTVYMSMKKREGQSLVDIVAYIWTPTAIMDIQAAAAICVRPTSLKVTILACEIATEMFNVGRRYIN